MPQAPRTVFTVYNDFHRPYIAMLNRILTPYRLYSAQWGVLRRLYYLEPQTVASLARVHCVETPTMTGHIQKLQRLGYVVMTPGEDKREKRLTLTDSGRDVCERLMPVLKDMHRDILGTISEHEQEACMALFETLLATIKQMEAR